MSPWAPKKPCITPGCSKFAVPRTSRCEEHLALLRQSLSRPSPAARGYGATWQKLRAAILERDGSVCTAPDCGQPASEVDHVQPKHLGGTDDPENLTSLCRSHHGAKTGRERQRLSMRDRS